MAEEEMVDVLDAEGRVQSVVTRREMRQRNLRHRCVYLLVFNRRGEVFAHLRTATKDVFPSHWDITIGGVPAAGEEEDAAAAREFSEELGIPCPTLVPLFPFRFESDDTRVVGRVYRAEAEGPFRLQEEEVVRGEWWRPESVEERVRSLPFCPDGREVWRLYRSLSREPRASDLQLASKYSLGRSSGSKES